MVDMDLRQNIVVRSCRFPQFLSRPVRRDNEVHKSLTIAKLFAARELTINMSHKFKFSANSSLYIQGSHLTPAIEGCTNVLCSVFIRVKKQDSKAEFLENFDRFVALSCELFEFNIECRSY